MSKITYRAILNCILLLTIKHFSLNAQMKPKIETFENSSVYDSITLASLPNIIYKESSDKNQYLNFEISIKNNHSYPIFLREIEGLLYDKEGKLVRKVFYNPNQRPSLEFINNQKILSKDSTLIFNPFHTFESGENLNYLFINLSFTDSANNNYQKVPIKIVPTSYESKNAFYLPIKGNILVWEGHDYYSNHRRLNYFKPYFSKQGITGNFQRFAYDFVVVDSAGSMYKGIQKNETNWYNKVKDNNEDYYCFGTPVFASADGIIYEIHDGEPDNRQFNAKDLKVRPKAYGGNYIIIKHANNEYSWYSHLKLNSILVKPGEQVKNKQQIALVGASGSALFPHLHFELRNGYGTTNVEGLPVLFSGIKKKGKGRSKEKSFLHPGTIIKN
jgi:Peptidase family M23